MDAPRPATSRGRLLPGVLAFSSSRSTRVSSRKTRRARVRQVEQAGKRVEAYFYDADHAFFNDARPTAYGRADAHEGWKRTIEFFNRRLGLDKELPRGTKDRVSATAVVGCAAFAFSSSRAAMKLRLLGLRH